ncbi:hypothetical protein DBB30_05340 [Yersinia pestis]|nr:hypothetical protein AU390_05255 [Yersinia pestis]PCN71007.1 hypothetical protein A8V19_04235 [Yersinia pestis]PVF33243.1 hypothetical protein A9317_05685 [Yersinia pestis]PVF35736.1 hypothetical protein A9312_04660 [Yersinia pestis]PWF36676.1 hypothetical protein DBB30_05340 [Yersinia pestis]
MYRLIYPKGLIQKIGVDIVLKCTNYRYLILTLHSFISNCGKSVAKKILLIYAHG